MTADEIFTHCIVEHGDGNICFSCAKEAVAQERKECSEFADKVTCQYACGHRIAQIIRRRGRG